jgi:hypothetical protein
MSDMHPEMANNIAENRGYDRGFTAGTLHAHNLIDQYMDWIKDYMVVLEDEGDCQRELACYQTQWNALDAAKKLIRTGHFDCDEI